MTENKKILVTDFIKEYKLLKSDELKLKKIQSVIKCTYCPILKKRALLDNMLEKSIDNTGVKHVDMFLNRINFYGAIVTLYTNLVTEKDENGTPKTFAMYDLLVENNILPVILQIIGQRELDELTLVNENLLDTWHLTNTSTEAYVKNLVDIASHELGVTAGAGMDKLADVLGDEQKMKKVIPMLEKMITTVKTFIK